MSVIVKRTTLIVRDIDAAVRWYWHVLGLTVYYDDEIELSGVGLAAGKKGDRTRLVILQAQDEAIGMIGLLQWVDPAWPAPAIPTSVGYGQPVFVCATDNVGAVCDAARELGTRIHAEPHAFSVTGADGSTKHFISASLFDPDGHFFEINQRVEAQTD